MSPVGMAVFDAELRFVRVNRILADINGVVAEEGPTQGMPRIETDIDATEVILMLAPETNGEVAVKAWHALEQATGREHAHLAAAKEWRAVCNHILGNLGEVRK